MTDTGENRKRPGRVSAVEQALRDTAIVAQLHAGEKPADVARQHDLSAVQIRRIFREYRARPTANDRETVELVQRVMRDYEGQLRNFALVAAHHIVKRPGVALGALKARGDALERFVELLSAVGKLPENLDLFRQEAEIVRTGKRMFVLMDEVANGRLSAVDARDELYRMFGISVDGDVVEEFGRGELGPGSAGG